MKVAVACGGTGGHIIPGIETARELERRGHSVTVWLSGRDVEHNSSVDWQGVRRYVPGSGFPAGISLRTVHSALRLFSGIMTARRLLRKDRPDLLLAMGSYAGVAPALAARMCRIPYLLHEANAVPGRANLMLARHATHVALHFEAAAAWFKHTPCTVTGFPLRKLNSEPLALPEASRGDFTLLVTGGSQGARFLNNITVQALCCLRQQGLKLQVLHLCGVCNEAEVNAEYKRNGLTGWVKGYWSDMGALYAAADFAVCRAGAATCAELALTGTPALLVPLPSAMLNHQEANARAIVAGGGADLCLQADLTPEYLCVYLSAIIKNRNELVTRSERMKAAACSGAAGRLADLIEAQLV